MPAKDHLAPHQRKAVSQLHNGSILCGGVGVGKSRTAIQYYVEKETPRDIYVITTAKKRDSLDWEAEAVAHGIGTEAGATTAGVLKVDSWNNLWRYVDVSGAFFIFDEQRLVGSGAWVRTFLKIVKNNNWILLSATPGDTWLDYIPVFVANGFYKNRTDFLREHVIYSRYSKFPKVERYIAVGRLVRYRNQLLVDMPYERHTKRVIKDVAVEHDAELFQKVVKDRWHPYEIRPIRDVAELYSVMRKVVNLDASRLEAVRSLTSIHPKLIVFYSFDYELEQLRSLGALLSNDGCRTIRNETNDKERSESCPNEQCVCQSGSGVEKNSSGCSEKKQPSPSLIRSYQRIDTTSTITNTQSSLPIRDAKTQKDGLEETTTIDRDTNIFEEKSSSGRTRKSSFGRSTTLDVSMSATLTDATDSLTNVVIAEWNGHKHEPIPKTDRWIYLVQYTAGAEGWNCTETDAVVFYSLQYSYRIFQQCQGRIDRMNTPFTELKYYLLRSKALIDVMIWKSLKSKKDFNERRSERVFLEVKT